MAMFDVNEVEKEARKEISDEAKKKAKDRLKQLFADREKAALAVKNIDRQIDAFKSEISELSVYEAAGVDVSTSRG